MAKLYPPQIEGTIPAFYGTTIVVPFSMNIAVGASEVAAIVLKIKKVNSNEVILTKTTTSFNLYANCTASFVLATGEQELFSVGQFYRAQIAYQDFSGSIGYFSSVSVIKYTSLPKIEIAGLDRGSSNVHMYDYVGVYTQTDDPTEKLYSSRFKLTDDTGNIIIDSGEIVHTVLNDTVPNQALEYFNIPRDLDNRKTYNLQLITTSVNGVVASSFKYKIIQMENSDFKFDEIRNLVLLAESDYENGRVILSLHGATPNIGILSGNFILSRSESKEPYEWEKIQKLTMKSSSLQNCKFLDYTIEQGKRYVYCIQQYNNHGIYSKRLLSNRVYADFEDFFLLDGVRQLKIKFNPKISSIKDNILETKVNTIGSKYPFITRNGRVNHKEFSLSGLISYQMDDNRDFMGWKTLGIEHNITDLISENIYAERTFKLEVLNWLNDGKPKILKSPTEGNYIVRLMGVSLSPNDTVGRMLHSFSCSASEIAPFNYNSLIKYKFIELKDSDSIVSKWKAINFMERIPLYDKDNNIIGTKIEYRTGELLSGQSIYSFKVNDMVPGSKIYINGEEIYIGSTGSYSAKVSSPIYSFALPNDAKYSGSLLFEYKDTLRTEFDTIHGTKMYTIPVRQIIGNTYWQDVSAEEIHTSINIIEMLEDIKTSIIDIPIAKFIKRGVNKIYVKRNSEGSYGKNSTFYINGNSDAAENIINLNDLDKLNLYEIHYSTVGCEVIDYDGIIKYRYEGQVFDPYTESYYDPQQDTIIEDSYDLFNVRVNDEIFNLDNTEERIIKGMKYNYLAIGDGIIAELTVLEQIIEYSYEYEDEKVKLCKAKYDDLYKKYQSNVISPTGEDLDEALYKLKQAYKVLLDALEEAIIRDYSTGG